MASPPSSPGENAIETEPSPGVATSEVGADGVVYGVTETGDDSAPAPAALEARNLIEYDVPFVRPVIDTGDEVPPDETSLQVPV